MMDDRLEALKGRGKPSAPLDIKTISIIVMLLGFALHLDISSQAGATNDKIVSIDKRIDFVLFQNQTYEKNMKILGGTQCASCHLTPNMVLPKSSLSMDQFNGYVRGESRFNQNSQMPKFDQSMISDGELEKLWKGLY